MHKFIVNPNLQTIFTFSVRVRVMVLNTTFNNISVISWWPVLLVKENGVPGENQISAVSN